MWKLWSILFSKQTSWENKLIFLQVEDGLRIDISIYIDSPFVNFWEVVPGFFCHWAYNRLQSKTNYYNEDYYTIEVVFWVDSEDKLHVTIKANNFFKFSNTTQT